MHPHRLPYVTGSHRQICPLGKSCFLILLILGLFIWLAISSRTLAEQKALNTHACSSLVTWHLCLLPWEIHCSFSLRKIQWVDVTWSLETSWAQASANQPTAPKQKINVVNHRNLGAFKQHYHNKNLTNNSHLIHLSPIFYLLLAKPNKKLRAKMRHWFSPSTFLERHEENCMLVNDQSFNLRERDEISNRDQHEQRYKSRKQHVCTKNSAFKHHRMYKVKRKKRRAQPTEYSIIFHDKITQSLLVDFTKAQKHNLLQ